VLQKHLPWTPTIQERFLVALANSGNVRHAAECIKRSPTTCYNHRQRDPAFAAAWDAAMETAMDIVLEPEAFRRAVQGVEKPVYHLGSQVGTVREYSDTLLIFLMKGWRPDRYKDRREVVHRGTLELLQKLERIGAMDADELTAFLKEVEQHVNQLEPEERP
jgi:hypothetical protein